MKSKFLLLLLVLAVVFISVGCENLDTDQDQTTPQQRETEQEQEDQADVTTSPSIVDTEAEFKAAISADGTWIICLTEDVSIEEDVVLDGEFTHRGELARKVALYSQDQDRNITDRYTLTAPKFTINSPSASIQHGTFVGDLYVSAKDFELVDTKVEGNVYFTSEDAKSTFSMDDDSEISGKQEMAE